MSIHSLPAMSLLRDASRLQTLHRVRVRRSVLPSSIRPNLFSGD